MKKNNIEEKLTIKPIVKKNLNLMIERLENLEKQIGILLSTSINSTEDITKQKEEENHLKIEINTLIQLIKPTTTIIRIHNPNILNEFDKNTSPITTISIDGISVHNQNSLKNLLKTITETLKKLKKLN